MSDYLTLDDLATPDLSDNDYDSFSAMWNEELNEEAPQENPDLFGDDFLFEDEEQQGRSDEYDRELSEHAKDVESRRQIDDLETNQNLASNFEELPDDLMFVSGGKEVSKATITNLIKMNEELKTAYDGMSGFSQDMEANDAFLKERSYAVTLEADKEIAALNRALSDPYLTNAERGELFTQRQQAEYRKSIVEREATAYTEQVSVAKVKQIEQRFSHMNTVMAQNHSDWNEIKEHVGSYIMSSGVPTKEFASVISPQMAEIVYKAYKYDKSIKDASNTLDSITKPTQQRAKPANKKSGLGTPRVNDAKRRVESGNFSQDDLSDVFNFLED